MGLRWGDVALRVFSGKLVGCCGSEKFGDLGLSGQPDEVPARHELEAALVPDDDSAHRHIVPRRVDQHEGRSLVRPALTQVRLDHVVMPADRLGTRPATSAAEVLVLALGAAHRLATKDVRRRCQQPPASISVLAGVSHGRASDRIPTRRASARSEPGPTSGLPRQREPDAREGQTRRRSPR